MEIVQCSALPPIESKEVAFDIETTVRNGKNADPYTDRILSLQISDGKTVWMLRNNFVSASFLLGNPDVKKIAHNASFDIKFLKHNLGIEISNIHDSLLTERLINSGDDTKGNGLGDVLARRLGVFTDKTIRTQFMEHTGEMTEEQIQYAAKDVFYLSEIRRQQLEDISKAGMGKVLALENAVVPIIAQMELDGIGFNRPLWEEYLVWFDQQKEAIKERVAKCLNLASQRSLFGGLDIELNLSSTEQVRAELAKLGCFLADTRENTLQDTLEQYSSDDVIAQFINDVLAWRGWEKLIGYKYHEHINPVTGCIHCSWNQLAAQTGRTSSSGPNLQQVRHPVEGEPNLRAAFIPDEDEVLVIADYSQQEPRVLAQLVGDPKMLEAASTTDMYTTVGEQVYRRKIEKKSEERRRLKIGMLAYFYGAYTKKLAYVLGVSLKEAEAFQKGLDTTFSKAVQAGNQRVQFVAQHGYMSSLLGRRCWLKDAVGAKHEDMWKYRNQALNGPVQMSSADMSKEAMRRFYAWTKENEYDKARLRLIVHDELVVSCPKNQAEEVKYALVGAMETAMLSICPDVRPEVEAHISPVWSKE